MTTYSTTKKKLKRFYNISGIYMIENKDTKQKYIGKSINIGKRLYQHIKNPDNCYIDNALRKHGEDEFNYIILADLTPFENLDNFNEILNSHEKFFIRHFNTYGNKFHYNLTEGGDGTRLLGENHPMYGIKGKDNPNFGKKRSLETRKKISESLKGENNGNYGRVVSIPERQAISKRMKKFYENPENHEMTSRLVKEKWKDPIYREKQMKARKLVSSNAEYKKKRSLIAKKMWSNPKHREKLSGENAPFYGKKHDREASLKISIKNAKTKDNKLPYRVSIHKSKNCKKGFLYRYRYIENGKEKKITSIDLKKLEEKVKNKNLLWLSYEEVMNYEFDS